MSTREYHVSVGGGVPTDIGERVSALHAAALMGADITKVAGVLADDSRMNQETADVRSVSVSGLAIST